MEAEGTEVAFDQDQLVHALYTSTRGAGRGGSRMRSEHLRAVVEERRIIPLYHVVKAVANDRVPPAIRPYLCVGSVTPLRKPATQAQPQPGIRPIVVGEPLLRLTGRILAIQNAARFRTFFLPLQFGVGVRGGAEMIIHTTRLATELHEDWAVFQADFKNAFNTISRQLILDQLIHHGVQDLLPYFILNYGQPSELSVRMANGSTQWFQSREGVRQGDPFAPFFFALGLQTVLSHLWDELGSPGIADTILEPLDDEVEPHTRAECWDRESQRAVVDPSALLDDIRFVGPWPTVLYAVHRLQQLIT